jgi:hypothetical protein
MQRESIPDTKIHLEAGEEIVKTFWPTQVGEFQVVLKSGSGSPLYVPVEFSGRETDVNLIVSEHDGRIGVHAVRELPDGTIVPLADAMIALCPVRTMCSSYSPIKLKLGSNGTFSQFTYQAGQYDLDQIEVPQGSYVASARQGNRDALSEGVTLSNDLEILEIRVRPGSGTLRSKAVDRQGGAVQDALIALLPEPPLDKVKLHGMLRSARTDQLGIVEFPGVIPGKYRAYAWASVSDDAYLDPDFIASYWKSGTPVKLQENDAPSVVLTILNEP